MEGGNPGASRSTLAASEAEALIIVVNTHDDDSVVLNPLLQSLRAQGCALLYVRSVDDLDALLQASAVRGQRPPPVLTVWSASANRSEQIVGIAQRALEHDALFPVSIDGARAPLGFRHVSSEILPEIELAAPNTWQVGVDRLVLSLRHHLLPDEAERDGSEAPRLRSITVRRAIDAFVYLGPFIAIVIIMTGIIADKVNGLHLIRCIITCFASIVIIIVARCPTLFAAFDDFSGHIWRITKIDMLLQSIIGPCVFILLIGMDVFLLGHAFPLSIRVSFFTNVSMEEVTRFIACVLFPIIFRFILFHGLRRLVDRVTQFRSAR